MLVALATVPSASAQEVRVTAPNGDTAFLPSLYVQAGLDFYTPPFSSPVKYEIFAKPPCGEGRIVKSATPVVFDGTLWMHYLCTNVGVIETTSGQTEIWIRYLRPQATPPPVPVYVVPTATPSSSTRRVTAQPGPVLYKDCPGTLLPTPTGCREWPQ